MINDEYDTITLDSSWNSTIPALTTAQIAKLNSISGPYTNLNVGVGTSGSSGASGSYYTTNGTISSQPWQNLTMTNNSQQSLNVKGDAEFEGKVKVNGQDLGEFMETISKRLAILVPDPEKLEHFEALKKAYEHYKMLEKLCELPKEEKE